MGAVDTHRNNDWFYKSPADPATWNDLLGSYPKGVQDLYAGVDGSQCEKRDCLDGPCDCDCSTDQYAFWFSRSLDDNQILFLGEFATDFDH